MKKKVVILSLLCLLFCTINYTYSAFRNTIEGTINISTNWVFKLNVPNGTKEENYYNVPISGTSGSFDITIDNSKNAYGASYVIELEPINLPDDIVINDLRYEDNITKNSKTYNVKYSSSSSVNGYIKVKVEATKYEYAVMKNGFSSAYGSSGGTEFWNNNYKSYIKTIEFNNNLENLPGSCTEENLCWDISYSDLYISSPNSVYGYLIDSGEVDSKSNVLYNLYIVSEYEIYATANCSRMFYNFSNLVSIEFNNNFNTSNVTSMSSMFNNCRVLTSLDLSNFNTSKVIYMEGMFSWCIALTNLDLLSFNTSKVTNMRYMFSKCKALTTLDLSGFNTSNVTDMDSMFSNCSALINLDLSNFNNSKVTDMYSMFEGCSALTSLDLSSFNASNVKRMSAMFRDCSALINLDLSNFNNSKVTDMYSMFSGCSALTNLDLSSFNTSNVTSMSSMFYNCSALTNLDLSSFNTSNVTDMDLMFSNCSALTNLDLSSFNTSNVIYMTSMFSKCKALTNLDLSSFNTSNVTYMESMFYNCSALTSLDLSSFNASNVTSMSSMFYNCSALTNLDLSSFNTSNVTSMYSMFEGCSALTNLDLSSFNTSNVTDMSLMFDNCSSLISIDLSSFNTSNVTSIGCMFRYYSSLTNLDLSSFNTSKVTSMNYMLEGCSALTNLDLSSFNTSNVTSMSSMFYNCSALTNLDLSSFNTLKVLDMRYMFYNCSALTNLDLSSFNTSNVICMKYMFHGCSALTTTINIMNPSLTDYSYIFYNTSINSNAQVTVNYIESASTLVDNMIATKSSNSNVIKGNIIYGHTITISDNTDITYQSNNTYVGTFITLNSISGNNYVTSFKMNGTLIEGKTFTMPDADVIITDITTVDCITIESDHNPYLNSQNNVIIGEHTFEGAKSLTVILDYQTETSYYDYFYIYDSASATTGIKYGGSTRTQNTITINSNCIKITFTSNSSGNDYYGLKAIVIPNYD